MKKILYSVILILVASVVIVSTAFADENAIPGTGWWSGEVVQNIGTSQATVVITAYTSTSSTTYTQNALIDPGKNNTFIPSGFSPTLPTPFEGSAVVSSDNPIKAIVTVTNQLVAGEGGVSGGEANAKYPGVDAAQVATTLYFPNAKYNAGGYTISFYIQNAGTSATTATATFKMKSGDTHVYNVPSIDPNEMAVFTVANSGTFNPSCTPATGALACRVGALTVQSGSSEPLAGVFLEHENSASPAKILAGSRGFTSSDFDTKAYIPSAKNARVKKWTGIQVQNVTASTPISISIYYKGNVGDATLCVGKIFTDTQTNIPAGKAAVFNLLTGQTTVPSNCATSATVETTTPGGQIVALYTELYVSGQEPTSGPTLMAAYAFPDNSKTMKIVAPEFKEDRGNRRSGFVIQNVDTTQATNVVATFQCRGGATFTAISNPQTINPGAAAQFYNPSTTGSMFTVGNPWPAGQTNVICGVTVTADKYIVALATEDTKPGAALELDSGRYEPINVTP